MTRKPKETMNGLTTKELLKLRKTKLENKKRHLQNLVSKRDRLNLEIKGALKSLKRELKSMKKPLRESLQLTEESTTQELLKELNSEANKDSEMKTLCSEIGYLENSIVSLAEPSPILDGLDRQILNDTF